MASMQVPCGLTCSTVSSSLILWRDPKLGENKPDIEEFSPHKQGVKVIVLFRNTQDSFRMILRPTRGTFLVVELGWQHTVRTSIHLFYKMGSEVQWSDVNWIKVKIFGEMFAFSLIYSYVAVCRFCAVCCVIIICISLLLSNYSTFVF
jgi:hypothetical protein